MDQMTNEFGDRLDKLERQCANDHCRVVRQVNIVVDEFVANNMDISDVDFDDVSMGHWE
jgi:hypothetical protein